MQEIIEIAETAVFLGTGTEGQCKIQNFDLININKKFRVV